MDASWGQERKGGINAGAMQRGELWKDGIDMPNRYVREDAIESDPVNSLSWQAEVFWRRLINRVDDFGRCKANAALLRSSIFPLQLDKVREVDMPRLLAECEEAGLLFRYAADGKPYLVMNKWERGRAKKSLFPDPPKEIEAKLDVRDYLGTGVHMGSMVGGVGTVGDGCTHTSPERGHTRSTPTPTPTNTSPPPPPITPPLPSTPPADRFQIPSEEDLRLHASKIGLPIPEMLKFQAFYESKGWMVGKRQMKSWHGAMAGWKIRWEESRGIKPSQSSTPKAFIPDPSRGILTPADEEMLRAAL